MKKITVSDVLHSSGIQTEYESSILLCVDYAFLSAVILSICIIYSLIKYGVTETISLFTDIHQGVIILILFWIFCLIGMFLHGYCYLCRLNQAVRHGTRLNGNIIEEKLKKSPAPISSFNTIFIIQLDNSKILKTPPYVYVPEHYCACDVYLYKRKYYFTGFRRSPFKGEIS